MATAKDDCDDAAVSSSSVTNQKQKRHPSAGPDPLWISRAQVDTLYETLTAVVVTGLRRLREDCNDELELDYILTGGSLLGAVRQHSILFTDDDVDIAILEPSTTTTSNSSSKRSAMDVVREGLPALLGPDYRYTVHAWEGGSDRVRHVRRSNVFVDVFALREYATEADLRGVLATKKNGRPQTEAYVTNLCNTIYTAMSMTSFSCSCPIVSSEPAVPSSPPTLEQVDPQQHEQRPQLNTLPEKVPTTLERTEASTYSKESSSPPPLSLPLFPLWHFVHRKSIELWPKEVYRPHELFPIMHSYKMGAVTQLCGPQMPVTLLVRAFGTDCFAVYYEHTSHHHHHPPAPTTKPNEIRDSSQNQLANFDAAEPTTTSTKIHNNNGNERDDNDGINHGHGLSSEYQPHFLPGGTWEGGVTRPLLPMHYQPMQSVSRAQRRPTLHDREALAQYLQDQWAMEQTIVEQQQHLALCTQTLPVLDASVLSKQTPKQSQQVHERRTIYMDGVFDLFHVGHLTAIQQCARLGDRVLIGVVGDKDAAGYKRPPIILAQDRVAVVAALSVVDKVICPCPLVVTEDFLLQHEIDLVVHGFANKDDAAKQAEFFRVPIQLGKFQQIEYYQGLSTTDIIQKISSLSLNDDCNKNDSDNERWALSATTKSINLQWFGSTLTEATLHNINMPYDPFPMELRVAIEPHIAKARINRTAAIDSVCRAAALSEDQLLRLIRDSTVMTTEGDFKFDTKVYPLRETLLRCGGMKEDIRLEQLHDCSNSKDSFCQVFSYNFSDFQRLFDEFVRKVCIPRMAASCCGSQMETVYYQSFPCIRIVQPGEFSIGPHADISYGHHAGSINFYVPFTAIQGSTASLFLESRPGSEDWHPILTSLDSYGIVKHFAGATCLHWTPENKTGSTRVSLDFRAIAGHIFDSLAIECGAYSDGYYTCCRRNGEGTWERVNSDLVPPDARTGFPWTIKDWTAYHAKKFAQ